MVQNMLKATSLGHSPHSLLAPKRVYPASHMAQRGPRWPRAQVLLLVPFPALPFELPKHVLGTGHRSISAVPLSARQKPFSILSVSSVLPGLPQSTPMVRHLTQVPLMLFARYIDSWHTHWVAPMLVIVSPAVILHLVHWSEPSFGAISPTLHGMQWSIP